MFGGGGGGSQPVMILSKRRKLEFSQPWFRASISDTNTKRDQGKKAQLSNIFAAKVGLLANVRSLGNSLVDNCRYHSNMPWTTSDAQGE